MLGGLPAPLHTCLCDSLSWQVHQMGVEGAEGLFLKKKIFYSLKILGVHFLALLNQTLNKTIALLTGQGREKDAGWVPWRQKKDTG